MSEIKVLNQNHERDTEALAGMMGAKDIDRFLKIQDPDTPDIERLELTWRMAGNQIVRLRRESRRELRTMHDLAWKRSEVEKQLKPESTKTFKNQFEVERLESLVRSLTEIIKTTRNVLASIGELATSNLDLYTLVATDHDFAQLINADMREVVRCRKDYEKRGRRNSSFFSDLIFVYKIETESEQPLFKAMFQVFLRELDRNKNFQGMAQLKVEELFPALKHMPRYILREDEYGNQIAEQIYQPLELV